MFSSAIGVDLLLSSDSYLPSLDDWGTAQDACGRISVGIMAHNALPASFSLAFPDWKAMSAENDLPEDTNIDALRHKIQKKCWRSRCVFMDDYKRRRILLLSWTGAAVEELISTAQYLDSQRRSLLDIITESSENPFHMVRVRLASLMRRGDQGPLEPLFAYIEEWQLPVLEREVQEICLDYDAQSYWRFLKYRELPYTFGTIIHPGVRDAHKHRFLDKFYAAKTCCLSSMFERKVREVWPTQRALLSGGFVDAVMAWSESFATTNMWCERLLAAIRNATDDGDVDVERVCAAGLLTQFATAHRQGGGDEPGYTTRGHLLEDGVALRCRPDETPAGQSGTLVAWMREMERKRKRDGGVLNKEEYKTWQRQKAEEWTSLSDQNQALVLANVRNDHAERMVQRQEELDEKDAVRQTEADIAAARVSPSLRTVVSDIGDKRSPCRDSVFEAEVTRAVGRSQGAAPGFTKHCDHYRPQQVDALFCEDLIDIPDDEDVAVRVPCPLAHPQLCATRDALIMPTVVACTKSLRDSLRPAGRGSFHLITFTGTRSVLQTWFSLSYQRGGGPRLNVLHCCTLDESTNALSVDTQGELFVAMIDITLVGLFFAQ